MTTHVHAPSTHPVPAVRQCIDAVRSAYGSDRIALSELRQWLKEISVAKLTDLNEEQAVAFEARLKEALSRPDDR